MTTEQPSRGVNRAAATGKPKAQSNNATNAKAKARGNKPLRGGNSSSIDPGSSTNASGGAARGGKRSPRPGAAAATHCAPATFGTRMHTGTCLSQDDVMHVARRVLGANAAVQAAVEPAVVVHKLHSALNTPHGREEKWMEAPQVQSDPALLRKLRSAFRPPRPPVWDKNPTAWLNTTDIDRVLRQYEVSQPNFTYLGAVPRDFASRTWTGKCIIPSMCAVSAESLLASGKDTFGVVFNMDTHDQHGSHWTSCFGCINPANPRRFGVFYYDSVGRMPPVEIQLFMQKFRDSVRAALGGDATKTFQMRYNVVRKQYQNTECGVYSVFFIVSALTTRLTIDTICRKLMRTDMVMQQLRDVFFRPALRTEAAHVAAQ